MVGAAIASAAAIACSTFSSSNDGADAGGDGGGDALAMPPPGTPPPTPAEGGPVACDAGAADAEVVVTPDSGAPSHVAVDAQHVYWSNDVFVRRAPVAGGAVELVAGEAAPIADVQLTSEYVGWRHAGDCSGRTITLGSGPVVLFSGVSAIASNATLFAGIGPGSIGIAQPPAPGSVIASTQGLDAVALGPTDVAWLALAPDGGAGSAIWTAKTVTGSEASVVLYDTNVTASALAVDVDHVYYADRDHKVVGSVPLAGGAPPVALATAEESLGPIALDGAYLYYASAAGVRRVAKAGGCIATLSTASTPSIAVGSMHVYYVDGPSVVRVPK